MVANTDKKIQRIVTKLPGKPGVYKMLSGDGVVLYVGKAKDLKKRVQSYFRKGAKHTVRIQNMLSKVEDIKYVVADTELEAVLLEYNLIKELKPRYNVDLKDDKSFVYVQVTVQDDFPKIKILRKPPKDGARYFGPKTSVKKVKKTIEVLRDLFPIRDCDLEIKAIRDLEYRADVEVTKKTIKYPCLQYHINTCIAPCIGNCTKDSYAWMVKQIVSFLDGNADEVMDMLKQDMELAVREKRFEEAAKVRDKLQAIESVLERQKISVEAGLNQDVVGYAVGSGKVFVNLFVVRNGRMIDSENFVLDARDVSEDDVPEVLESFLGNYYEKCGTKPNSVLLPVELPEKGLLEKFLELKILNPKRGEKNELVKMSNKNAEHYYKQMMVQWETDKQYDPEKALEVLQKKIGLKKKIRRMEGYDISHNSGEFTVGSMVVFEGGEPKNKDYRQFKMRTLPDKKVDDFASLQEVLTRRLRYILMPVPKGITIRKGLKKDLSFITEMFGEQEFVMKDFVILEEKKKIVGCGRLNPQTKEKDVINSLWVSPDQRGKGLGHVVLHNLIKRSKAKRIYIGCRLDNAGFYEKFGFTQVKKVPDFMGKALKGYAVFVFEKKSDASFGKMPDVVVLDGGKGQLSSVTKIWERFGANIPLLAMDKSGKKVWFKGKDLGIKEDSQGFFLIQRMMDEAHRFSNRLREKQQIGKLTRS